MVLDGIGDELMQPPRLLFARGEYPTEVDSLAVAVPVLFEGLHECIVERGSL
jgi:hypothetical protein